MDTLETLAVAAAVALAAALIAREIAWRRAQAELRATLQSTTERMRDHEQRAQVGDLVSGLAQELKSPLQGVIGNTELMLASGRLSAASAGELREIQDNAVKAAGIIRNLLAFTETVELSRRWQDINDLAGRAIDGVRPELEASGVQVQVALAEPLPLMYVDGRQLEKVIATLLSRPSTGVVGAVTAVTLATRRSEPPANDERLVIDIDDRSAASDDEPAWSGDLAACRQIVQAHGGSLEVERPENGGYRFHLELPVTSDAGAAVAI